MYKFEYRDEQGNEISRTITNRYELVKRNWMALEPTAHSVRITLYRDGCEIKYVETLYRAEP